MRVDVIDVGQGTSTLVRFPTGETMLVDGGGIPDDSYDIGRGVLAPFLWHEGIRRLNYVALSHDHPDHGAWASLHPSQFRRGVLLDQWNHRG